MTGEAVESVLGKVGDGAVDRAGLSGAQLDDAADRPATFIDSAAAASFRLFHHAAATLRIIARERNLAMAAGQRRPRIKRPVLL